MTVHRDKFLVNKTNRRTEFQFYWYYESTSLRQSFCPSSGSLNRTSAVVQFMQFGDRVLPGLLSGRVQRRIFVSKGQKVLAGRRILHIDVLNVGRVL
jgi:hypothetical protein